MELMYVVSMCFCSLISTACSLSTSSGVNLEENGYKGVIVGISSDVPENPRLVEIIKDMFTNASSDLYQATKGRAYFRDVTILIPSTWTGDQWDLGPPNITYTYIDVTITQSHDVLEDGSVDLPYTKQIEGCGKPGVSIYMTSQFIQQHQEAQHLYGNYGKILVHEWGHYRWGLFDEYPNDATEGKNPESFYFSTKTQRWRPIGCSNQWEMIAVKRIATSDSHAEYTYITCEGNDVSGYEEGCVALPSARHRTVNGSIMEGNLKFQTLPMFCDSDPNDPTTMHNTGAPNRQNLECGGRSTWEIMREHEDFNDGRNPPRVITYVTPSFNVIRARPPRLVFVIDYSNEMKIDDRMSKVTSSVNCFIKSMVPDGTLAGLVIFDRQAYVLHDLQEIDRADPRGKFENWFQVNISRDTDSSAESGVVAAMKVLSQQNDTGGGKVVLITAGKGWNSTLMGVEEGQYSQQGIVIDALIYNDAAADIFDIVDATGGKLYLLTNSSGVEGLLEALVDVISGTGSKPLLKTENDGLREGALVNICSTKNDDVAPISSSLPLSVKDCPVEVSVRINWNAGDLGSSGIKPFAIYAEVHRCEDPIIGVEVTAIIERPTDADSKHSQPFELKLSDNGAGADLRRHDGVYSRYFTQFTGPGIYGVTVKANNNGTAKVLKHLRNRLPRSFINPPFYAEDLLSGNFSNNDTGLLPGEPTGDLEGEGLHNFNIGTSGGATHVTSSSPDGDDITPPSKITDLALRQYAENATVTLTFTAPGDNYDDGYASRYYIYISNSRTQLVNNVSFTPLVGIEDILKGNVSSPSEAGTRETFVIRVHFPPEMETVSYHFGVIAEDDAGNRGNMSSPVQAVFQNLSAAVSEEYLSTESAVITTIKQYFSTDIFSDSTALTLHSTSPSTSVTVATKAMSTAQPEYCERVNCVFIIGLSVMLFVIPASALVLSLCTVLIIRHRRKCSKVSTGTQDVELTEEPTDKTTSNRT